MDIPVVSRANFLLPLKIYQEDEYSQMDQEGNILKQKWLL